ncbi:hypothetical protein NMA510612_1272 [Neisseria meningitidis]|uniref:Uncharacterized protein n=2 Tax=Neisseria meningitidis TaxID=487 RepID=X5F6D8_NEIME|nr:hypothetical protein NMA510612_1272 [Neisseria meningitidis]CCA44868.1 hypothetical protein NMALPHA522_1327 [Neisseria meningitidis alpha522]
MRNSWLRTFYYLLYDIFRQHNKVAPNMSQFQNFQIYHENF